MSAIRLARGFTGRSKIIKFEGCYHGHADFLLVKAGSGALTFGNPTSAGVPAEVAAQTLVLDYNDVAGLERTFAAIGNEIACVIVEPVAGNMNLVKPDRRIPGGDARAVHPARRAADFRRSDDRLPRRPAAARRSCSASAPTSPRSARSSAAACRWAPSAAARDIMDKLAPLGPVYQAGTLSGNPVAVAAGLATLEADCTHRASTTRLAASTERLVEA